MKRRKFLKSVAIAGTTGLIFPSVLSCGRSSNKIQQETEGMLQKGPRKSFLEGIVPPKIKITDIKVRLFSTPIPVEKWWVGCGVDLVTEVYTDQGVIGIGGPSPYGGVEDVKKYTEEVLKPAFVGQNPFDVEYFFAGGDRFKLPDRNSRNRSQSAAFAGVDIACWDIIGKVVGQPVYKLLAIDNPTNTRIEHYASAGTVYDWLKKPEVLYDEALGYKSEGFKSFKFRLGDNFEKACTLDRYITFIRKLRETVGPDLRLMQESNMRLTLEQCLELVPVLEELNFTWFEEPINSRGITPDLRGKPEGIKESIDGHLKIKAACKKLLISGGESKLSREEFKDWIDNKAYDIVQPDCNVTGITEAWNIARMANVQKIPCVPHNWHGALTWMSNIQLVAGIPNYMILESDRNFNPLREGMFTEPIVVKDSFAEVPSKPGLGVELIPDAEKKFPYDPKNDWRNMTRV